jgi:hypothetical protein
LVLGCLLSCATGFAIARAAEPEPPASTEKEPQFGPGNESLVYSIESLQGDDPDGVHLTGLRASFGRWVEDEFYERAFLWGAFQQGENQKVTSAGAEFALGPPFGPFRVMPRFRLGFEHRAEPPDDGFAGLAGIGIELNLWLGRHLQVAVSTDRDFGFPSGTRNLTGLALRWGYVTKPVRLSDAVGRRDVASARRLLESGVNMESHTAHGALVGAAMHCDREMLTMLLDAWKGPSDDMTERALRMVVDHCEPDLITLLLERGADPNANHDVGGTVLMKAAAGGQVEAARALVEGGADVNGRGRYDHAVVERECRATPLMMAAETGNGAIVDLLLKAGADPAFRDTFGCTAEEAARRGGHDAIAQTIRSHVRP